MVVLHQIEEVVEVEVVVLHQVEEVVEVEGVEFLQEVVEVVEVEVELLREQGGVEEQNHKHLKLMQGRDYLLEYKEGEVVEAVGVVEGKRLEG